MQRSIYPSKCPTVHGKMRLSSRCIHDAVAYLPLCGFCYGIVSGALLALTGMAVPMCVYYRPWYNMS